MIELKEGRLYVASHPSYGKDCYRLGESQDTDQRKYGYNTYYKEPVDMVYKSDLVIDKKMAEDLWFILLKQYHVKNSFYECDIEIIRFHAEQVVSYMNSCRLQLALNDNIKTKVKSSPKITINNNITVPELQISPKEETSKIKPKIEPKIKIYECTHCGKKFNDNSNRHKHQKKRCPKRPNVGVNQIQQGLSNLNINQSTPAPLHIHFHNN